MLDIVSERSQIYVSTIGFKDGTVIGGAGRRPVFSPCNIH